jgi:hypothetical protein
MHGYDCKGLDGNPVKTQNGVEYSAYARDQCQEFAKYAERGLNVERGIEAVEFSCVVRAISAEGFVCSDGVFS